MQLPHCLASLGAQNRWMDGPKVDEIICKLLKPASSDLMFNNIVIIGQYLFFLTHYGANLTIMHHPVLTRDVEMDDTGGFASKPETHYMPW
jgi:hypothetical protein